MVLTQLSDAGSNTTAPTNTITLNGFTFSTFVACGWFKNSTSSYLSVKISPVFWIFGSRSLRFCEGSAVVRSIPGSYAKSAAIEKKSTGAIAVALSLAISRVERRGSIRVLSLKSLTINPDLNLSNPFWSVTAIVFAVSSSIVKLVTSSRLSILSSNLPISRMVNLLLSLRRISGFLTVLYKYAGNLICASSIASSARTGGAGVSLGVPVITSTLPNLLRVTRSILGK